MSILIIFDRCVEGGREGGGEERRNMENEGAEGKKLEGKGEGKR